MERRDGPLPGPNYVTRTGLEATMDALKNSPLAGTPMLAIAIGSIAMPAANIVKS